MSAKEPKKYISTSFHLDEECVMMLLSLSVYFNELENEIFDQKKIIDRCIENVRLSEDLSSPIDPFRMKENKRSLTNKKNHMVFYIFSSQEQKDFLSNFLENYKSQGIKIYLNMVIKTFIYETYNKLITS